MRSSPSILRSASRTPHELVHFHDLPHCFHDFPWLRMNHSPSRRWIHVLPHFILYHQKYMTIFCCLASLLARANVQWDWAAPCPEDFS